MKEIKCAYCLLEGRGTTSGVAVVRNWRANMAACREHAKLFKQADIEQLGTHPPKKRFLVR